MDSTNQTTGSPQKNKSLRHSATAELELMALRRQLDEAVAAANRFNEQANEALAMAGASPSFRMKVQHTTRQTIALANAQSCLPTINRLRAQIEALSVKAAAPVAREAVPA